MKNLPLFLLILAIAGNCRPEENGKRVNIRGKNVYYEEYGNGTPLLLLSGGGHIRSIKDFDKCIPGLSAHFRVIAPDTPGQGKSDQADTLTYQVLTETMSALIDSLKVDSIYVMGWSDGGIVSILLAESRPDKVKKAIAVGPNNGKRGFNIPPGYDLASITPPSPEEFEKTNKEFIATYSAENKDWRKYLRHMNAMWYADEYFPVSTYGRIKIPVMIVLGDRDMISLEHGAEMYKAIAGSQFCVIPNTSHDVFAERPEEISAIAVNFFK